MTNFSTMRTTLLSRLVSGEITRDDYDWMMHEVARREAETTATLRPTDTDQDGTSTAVKGAIQPGTKLGVYKITKLLGKGGNGEVWLAWEEVGGFFVVIKTLPPLAQSPEPMKGVLAVFHRVRQLQHQHICPVYTLGFDPAVGYFFAMKFVEGATLDRWIQTVPEEDRPISVVHVLRAVADALDYSHRRRVVHRDIKPQNIMICDDGKDVQVIDFGLAAQIQATTSQAGDTSVGKHDGYILCGGTPAYMAPEQWQDRTQDARTDQYSLGVVAYELICGKRPFAGDDLMTICGQTVNEAVPEIPGASVNLNAVLRRVLAKKRADRFASCSEFVSALEKALLVDS